MPLDRIQQNFEVGTLVSIVGRVTAIGGTPAQPTVTIQTKYASFAGSTTSVGPVDSIQVIVETQIPIAGNA
jgi:hypothetical protein